jgi:hypothetical protein
MRSVVGLALRPQAVVIEGRQARSGLTDFGAFRMATRSLLRQKRQTPSELTSIRSPNTVNCWQKRGPYPRGESSILIVVGRKDTGDLEAHIRGSRHAWDIRLISVDALLRLMNVKQDVEDPRIIKRVNAILVPREFTRIDEIVEILFSTTEDIKGEQLEDQESDDEKKPAKFTPVAFNEACVKRIEGFLKKSFINLISLTWRQLIFILAADNQKFFNFSDYFSHIGRRHLGKPYLLRIKDDIGTVTTEAQATALGNANPGFPAPFGNFFF